MPPIHIIVSHTHSQDDAFDRVIDWLNSMRNTDYNVKEVDTNIKRSAHRIDLDLIAYGYPLHVGIDVSPSQVELKTSDATDLKEEIAMRYEQGKLQSQLQAALR